MGPPLSCRVRTTAFEAKTGQAGRESITDSRSTSVAVRGLMKVMSARKYSSESGSGAISDTGSQISRERAKAVVALVLPVALLGIIWALFGLVRDLPHWGDAVDTDLPAQLLRITAGLTLWVLCLITLRRVRQHPDVAALLYLLVIAVSWLIKQIEPYEFFRPSDILPMAVDWVMLAPAVMLILRRRS